MKKRDTKLGARVDMVWGALSWGTMLRSGRAKIKSAKNHMCCSLLHTAGLVIAAA